MKRAMLAIAALMMVSHPSAAAVIGLGPLSVTIDDGNGGVASVALGGNEYYNLGTPVSDWMLRLAGDAASYRLNPNGSGADAIGVGPVACDAVSCTLSASFFGVDVTRTYEVLAGSILRTTTSLTNTSDAEKGVDLADAFDPDQGIPAGFGFNTFNDILPGVGTSVSANAFGVTYSAVGAHLSFLSGLGIFSSAALDAFFSGVIDPNGAFADIGIGVGYHILLEPGATEVVSFDQQFAVVPEPGTLALLGLGLLGVGVLGRRRLS